MAGLGHARPGNVMTYGLMNDGMFGRGKISLYVRLYNGGRVGYQILCLLCIIEMQRSDESL
jgi:hypothetical protein